MRCLARLFNPVKSMYLYVSPRSNAPPSLGRCSAHATTMMGGGVQDVVDNYVAGALLSVEAALDDEMNRMQNLNVCSRRHTCPHTHCPAADACA